MQIRSILCVPNELRCLESPSERRRYSIRRRGWLQDELRRRREFCDAGAEQRAKELQREGIPAVLKRVRKKESLVVIYHHPELAAVRPDRKARAVL